ncbi:MAG: hypothetical protein IJU91_03850 [Selenomonadaceae bacterium]|nr:hypothetical protein [Selenomonadaceae bacterium]
MSVDNVCMWSNEKGAWQKVTAEEIVRKYPNIGTVSAYGKLFMCELCGQYVTLARGQKNRAHFRHLSAEQDKDCKDRSKQFELRNSPHSVTNIRHDLPLRIFVGTDDFYFEVGLLRLPEDIFEKISDSIITITNGESEKNFSVQEYLRKDSVTWLNVGNMVTENYTVKVEPACSELNFYWGAKIGGVNMQGTLFHADSGRKLQPDSDVKIDEVYYLLTTQNLELMNVPDDVAMSFKIKKYINGTTWRIYKISATAISEKAAKFFLGYHYRLTARTVSMQPIYPVFTNEPNVTRHDSSSVFFYFTGDFQPDVFPLTKSDRLFEHENAKLIKVNVKSSHQIVAARRRQTLEYMYLWRGLPADEVKLPAVTVTDILGNDIATGISYRLPKNFIMQIYTEFDGFVLVSENGVTVNKISLKEGFEIDISTLHFGMSVKIFQGLDCVFEIVFERQEENVSQDDEKLYALLERGTGRPIKIPHAWGNAEKFLASYPKVKSWLYKSIRAGFATEESFNIFRNFLLNELQV